MKSAIVAGTGAGGATVAKELQGHFNVTILEAGREFSPFSRDLSTVCRMKKFGLLFNESEISLLFPTMKIRGTRDVMTLVKGTGLGRTTTIATGNSLRLDEVLRKHGIDLAREYDELEGEIPITTSHQNRWHKTTRRLFEICKDMHLDPRPTPNMGDNGKCQSCRRCVLGCVHGAKWDAGEFTNLAVANGGNVENAMYRRTNRNKRRQGDRCQNPKRARFCFPSCGSGRRCGKWIRHARHTSEFWN